jgi:formate C-acetyltransferase
MSTVTLSDLSLKNYALSPCVANLREAYFKAVPEVCIERPRLVTRFSAEMGLFDKKRISILDKARVYRQVLENRTVVVQHASAYDENLHPFEIRERSLFAGSTTSKFKGVPLYPEFLALTLWPELWTLPRRQSNPFQITEAEIEELNFKIFPRWIDNNITELARKRCFEENLAKYGRPRYAPELKLLERLVFFLASKPECISHTIPDFSRAIALGLRGVIEDAQNRQAKASDQPAKDFYAAIAEVLEGIIRYSRKLAGRAREMAAHEANPASRKELSDIAEIHERVPEYPARTFREALTTVWICWTAIHLENPNIGLSLGRLDQVLYPAYRRDIDSGALSIEQAIELLCCLWLKIGDHVPSIPNAGQQLFGGTGSNQAITIGGVDRAGQDAVNDLTYVILRATELMKLRDPNLNARYYVGVNSKDYLRRLCEANINTGATPALHNDRAVIRALTAKGDGLEHARDYGVIGCVEPGSNGRFYGHSAAILMNLTSVLDLTLFNGRHRHTGMKLLISKETGDPRQFKSFEEFKSAFHEQARWLIGQCTTLNNLLGRIHQDFYPTPILSSLFEGPMAKGKDLIEGGAVINSSGAAIIGLADVADSLSAIQKHVFLDRTVTMAALLAAIEDDKNFEGQEALQKRLANPAKTPKYGNEDPLADANVAWLVEMLNSEFGAIENYRGGRYRVGYWTMTNHAGFGRLMGALPNGRKAHENFASGITPVSGATLALTPALNSVASLRPECLSNGVALNIKYTPEVGQRDRMLGNFVAAVEGYFHPREGDGQGGMEIQFNITSHDTFVDAAAHPENYPELLVRVSGYTAYFKDLNPQMQQEIIERTEYVLSPGTALHFGPFSLAASSG